MHYQKNFLTKIVLRLDFGEILALRGEAKPEFSDRIQTLYPIAIGKPTSTLSVTVGPKGSGIQQEITGMLWEHRKAENGTKVVSLSPTLLSVEYGQNDYDHFPPFRAEVEHVFGALQSLYQVTQVNRIGLRYINEISLQQGNALDWDNLIKPGLITSVKACLPDSMTMVRSFHQLQAQRDNLTTIFNYGLYNPDYPNPLARRQFVLDYDCFRADTLATEVMQTLDSLNDICEAMFEASIEEGLRSQMGVIDD